MVQFDSGAWPAFYGWNQRPFIKRTLWSFGWWTGPDQDLLCVRRNLSSGEAQECLSPVCSNRGEALLAFLLKRLLSALDLNMKG